MLPADLSALGEKLPLRDIHLPPAPSCWPPAPGWWMLLSLAVLLLLILIRMGNRYRRLRYRRQALRELEILAANTELSATELLAALSALLRRAVLCVHDRNHCAALSGEKWLEFLDRGLEGAPFSQGDGRCLARGPYQPGYVFDRGALLELCRHRLRKLPAMPRKKGRA